MKRFFKYLLVIISIAIVFEACSKYDDTDLREKIANLDKRVTSLEERVNLLNGDISIIRVLVERLEKNIYVTSVKETETGYGIVFSDGNTVFIHNGENGEDGNDGHTPQLGVSQDEDGIWYWTLEGEWLMNTKGDKCPVTGKDGVDGKDGITPQMKIEDDYWYVSFDNGETWAQVGKATGNDGKDGDSLFISMRQDSHFVYFQLSDGTVLQLTKFNLAWDNYEPVHCIENEAVNAYLQVSYNNADYSYSCVEYLMSSSLGMDFDLPNGRIISTDLDNLASSRTLEYADNPEYFGGKTIALDLSSNSYALYDLVGEKVYYYRVFKDNDPYLLLNSGKFQTAGAIKFIKVDAVKDGSRDRINNIRDLGGWNVGGNRTIRYGILFRGSEPNHMKDGVFSSYITNRGIEEMKSLGITSQLDLRESRYAEESIGKMWASINYSNHPLDQWFYRLNIYCSIKNKATLYANAIRQVLVWLREGQVIYIHCQGGSDRTGALCAIIEGICGVSENDINHDYELSGRNRSREYYSKARGDNYDGDFKYAMEYIKGLIKYNDHIYVYYRGDYYDAERNVTDFNPIPIVEPSLVNSLSKIGLGTLQDRFRLLMEMGGLSPREMDELENLLCS